jgi:lipopolysaccharide export system protein LptA
MILGRKFKIWLTSFIVVLIVFLFFRIFGNVGSIKISKPDYQIEQGDVNGFTADSNAGRVGQARLEYVERARFETVDPKTRKLRRVVGFEKILHKSGNEWELDKPYMNVFQDNLRCNITADTGTVELENVEGANPSPKQAVLKGNVLVHVLPQGGTDSSESFIFLNEVAFDSDRSMLWSNDDVNFISADADLMGKGLEIVYNNATNRLEFLKIKKVDFLNIKRLAKIPDNAGKPLPQTSEKAEVSAKTSEPAADKSTGKKEPAQRAGDEEDYQCLFRDNVRIEYKNEVILSEEIAITKLLWSQKGQQDQQSESQPQMESPSSSQSLPQSQTGNQTAVPEETLIKPDEKLQPPKEWKQRPVVATVRCDGPMIVKPLVTKIYDGFKPAPFRGFNQLDSELSKRLGRRNVLIGQTVNYDIASQTASAAGRVELVFYPQIETAKGHERMPFIISARRGAQFVVPDKEATFHGDVKGKFVKQTDSYDEENVFYGDKLIATLSEKQNSQDIMAAGDISHITVLGPGVRLESIRTLAKTKLSHVRLKSERIDYDRATEDIIAAGKGKIEYSNTAQSAGQSTGQKSLDKPCFALIEGFTKLVWDTNAMHVNATSEKSGGIHIGYLPVLANGYGRRTTIDTCQIDIDYFEPIKGKAQIKRLKATGGIVYYEQGRYEFAGKELTYNATEDFMTISGSPEMPCMLNGVFAEGIEYNLKTGAASATMSGGVGIMPVRE